MLKFNLKGFRSKGKSFFLKVLKCIINNKDYLNSMNRMKSNKLSIS